MADDLSEALAVAHAARENDGADPFNEQTRLDLASGRRSAHVARAGGQAVAAGMLERGYGRIVFTASLLSFQGGITVPGYTAAKSGIAGLVKALSNEWSARGVTVNAIAPGYIATDNTAALRADEDRSQAILDRIPAGRWGSAEDLQGATVFLASPSAAYVTGVTLPVDGGWMAR